MQKIKPMLCGLGSKKDLNRKNFIYEPKFDGTRAIVYKKGKKIQILNRRGVWIESRYPEFSDLRKFIKARSTILDGEILVLDKNGLPSFNLLQMREHLARRFEIELRSKEIPATLIVFDVVELNGKNLMRKPLKERKKILSSIIKENDIIAKCIFTKNGKKLFKEARKMRLEGVIAKDENSPYVMKRSNDWLKIKFLKTMDCIVIGYREGFGKRFGTFGSLCLGIYHDNKLMYIGRVGTGWPDSFVKEFYSQLKKFEVKSIPVKNPPENWHSMKIHWVKPKFVCEVEFLQLTKNLELRAPSFKRLREDKLPKECIL